MHVCLYSVSQLSPCLYTPGSQSGNGTSKSGWVFPPWYPIRITAQWRAQGPISHVVLDIFLKRAINNNYHTIKISSHILFVCFWVRVSLCIPGCSGANHGDQIGLELIEAHLPLPPGAGIKGICHHTHPSIYILNKVRQKTVRVLWGPTAIPHFHVSFSGVILYVFIFSKH